MIDFKHMHQRMPKVYKKGPDKLFENRTACVWFVYELHDCVEWTLVYTSEWKMHKLKLKFKSTSNSFDVFCVTNC